MSSTSWARAAWASSTKRLTVASPHGRHQDDDRRIRREPRSPETFLSRSPVHGDVAASNIVIVYDLGDQDGNPYLVMEYLEGEPLDKMIAGKRELSMVEKLGFIIQCCTD